MQGNKPVQAWVLETQSGSVRLLTEGRRESKLSVSRLLPWLGPMYPGQIGKQEMSDILVGHRIRREELAASVNIDEIWELAQGEVEKTQARWLAELQWENPDIDQVAAMGHAALASKTRFRFSPPDFEIYDSEKVALRESEQASKERREAFAVVGGEFFRELWACQSGKRGPLAPHELPPEDLAATLADIVKERLADPEKHDADGSWKLLTKSLPDEPFIALRLAEAWGLVPKHHNYLMDQADYDVSPDWGAAYPADIAIIRDNLEREKEHRDERAGADDAASAEFYSIDAASTRDVDDAFTVTREPSGEFAVSLIFACPAIVWPFGSALDKAVLRRTTSLYLPEGDFHMMPEETGLGLFGLSAGETRPVLRVDARLDADGALLSLEPRLDWAQLAGRLTFEGVQNVLAPSEACTATPEQVEAAQRVEPRLRDALELAKRLQERRIATGAVITDRVDPIFTIENNPGEEIRVSIKPGPVCPEANLLVSELMIFTNHSLAQWALDRGIPLFHRTQDVALPKEFAGVWTEAHEVTRVVKHLPPASLETTPRPHAGLGLKIYAPLTSPLRRYTDLVNEGQIVHYLRHASPMLNREELDALLGALSPRMEIVGRVQRFRPRYWKLLFFQQRGDKEWWDAVVTDENDHFATLSLPLAQIFVRAKRRLLGDKVYPGQRFSVRVGKVTPLLGEIQILDAQEE